DRRPQDRQRPGRIPGEHPPGNVEPAPARRLQRQAVHHPLDLGPPRRGPPPDPEQIGVHVGPHPAERREQVETAARTALRTDNPTMAEFMRKHPSSPMVTEPLRPYLKRMSGWRGE
ncbi:MAG: hypothetical protein ACO1SX_15450, partial [Actinomycetota bacterium]